VHVSSKGSTGSYDRENRGVGADLRRAFRLGVRSPESGLNDVRRMAGVKPVDPISTSCSNWGPGSENRTLFLDFFGVEDVVLCLRSASSDPAAKLCRVRCETGDWPGIEELFFLFLPSPLTSIIERVGIIQNIDIGVLVSPK
jgi:hypothetical protein